jgi:hypothetical protein
MSNFFVATGDVEVNFTIQTAAADPDSLDLSSGRWCDPDVGYDMELTWQAETDSTGHYCFDYSKTAEPEDIILAADHGEHKMGWLTLEDVECDDQVANFELYPECDTISVDGWVYDKMTGEPIEDAYVYAFNDMGFGDDFTNANGYYFIELPFDPDNITKVIAGAEGYTPHEESMYIPKCGYAYQTFQLHQTPKSRVLLYHGNGGVSPADEAGALTDYYTLQSLYQSLGFIVDYTDVWPTEFDWTLKYKLIVLLAPGHDSGDDLNVDGFTIGQKADLDRYLEQSGVLVVLTDHSGFTGQAVENDLLNDLPVELQFNSNSWADGLGNQIVDPVGCQTAGVAVFDTDQWTDILDDTAVDDTWFPGDLILQNASADPVTNCPNCVMYAADYPSHGNGEVKVVGDLNFVDDASVLFGFNWHADNEEIPFNWLICDP